jgi:hypothetical protein
MDNLETTNIISEKRICDLCGEEYDVTFVRVFRVECLPKTTLIKGHDYYCDLCVTALKIKEEKKKNANISKWVKERTKLLNINLRVELK